jgi:hypothetical protein
MGYFSKHISKSATQVLNQSCGEMKSAIARIQDVATLATFTSLISATVVAESLYAEALAGPGGDRISGLYDPLAKLIA